MQIGTVKAIHRYPVKSMAGETLSDVHLGEGGIPGDRGFAVRDEERGGIRGAKKIPALMECSARYPTAPEAGVVPPAEITLPGGERFLTSDDRASELLSEAVGRKVTLWPLLPADALDHYRRGAPDNPDFEKELRSIFAREPGEPLPDIMKFPPEVLQFESPPGTYFDAFPLLLMTETSLASMQARKSDSLFDARRFRPNFLLEGGKTDDAFPEVAWVGRRLRLGDAVLKVQMECPRCVMTTHGFSDLPEDPGVMRALVREAGGNLGVYATVEEPGAVRTGDTGLLLD